MIRVERLFALCRHAFGGHAFVSRLNVIIDDFWGIQHVCQHHLQLRRVPWLSPALFRVDVVLDFAVLLVR